MARKKEILSTFALHPRSGGIPIPKSDVEFCTKRGRYDVTARVRRVIGLGPFATTLPKDLSLETVVDGRRVVIKKSGKTGEKKHRMFIETNSGKLVPTGRLHQAVCSPERRYRRHS
jgi:hypothetical protein